MDAFLTFIGIIALLFVAKFIYDSYLTNNTEKVFEEYQNNNPEAAARIERNKGFDLSTKPKTRSKDKEDSLLRMARNMGCTPDEVKEGYIEDLKSQNLDQNKYSMMIQILKEKKYEESKLLNIDPDDTSSAYMEKWTKEYFNKIDNFRETKYDYDKNIENEEAYFLNEKGEDKLSKGSYNEAIELFSSAIQLQPQVIFFHNRAEGFYKSGQKEFAKADYLEVVKLEPDKNYRNVFSKLTRIYMEENDFETALIYIDKVIQFSPERKIALYNRAVAHLNLGDRESAIEDLKLLVKVLPNYVNSYILLGDIYLKEQNLNGAQECIDAINLREFYEPNFNVNEKQAMAISHLKFKYYDSKLGNNK